MKVTARSAASLSRRWLTDKLRDPVVLTDSLQIVKTVVAAVAAWVVAVRVFHLEQPFLAPWAALLIVHATVYRTLSRGVQQVGATVLGVLLAFGVGSILGVNVATIAFALLLALLIGGMGMLRAEGITIATTSLIVLTTGYSQDTDVLVSRLWDTAIGIGCGVLVNLLIYPPLSDRSAARQVEKIDDRVGALLGDVANAVRAACSADEIRAFVDRTRELDHDIDHAWSVVSESDESLRFNLRRTARRVSSSSASYADVLHGLEQAVAESRSMFRTLGTVVDRQDAWDPMFAEVWLQLLTDAAEAVVQADPRALEDVRARLSTLVEQMSTQSLPGLQWPTYGALVVNLRNIVDALVSVAAAQPGLLAR